MRRYRKERCNHMRLVWRQAYWKRHGFPTYKGVALGGMEISKEVRREVETLRTQLHRWNFEYYVWAAGPDDATYDRAYDRLVQLEEQYPQLEDPNSPTCLVGASIPTGDRDVKHRVKMLSLEKAKTPEAVVKFFDKDYEGVVEPKVDGFSLSLKYVNGRLIQAITRGNGETGCDVTPNARTIGSLPKVFLDGKKFTMEVRGEAFIKWSDFERYNRELVAAQEEPCANPRNAVGAINAKNPADTAKVPLSFIGYSIVGFSEGNRLTKHTDELGLLEELGFITPSALPATLGECASMYQVGFNIHDLAEVTSWVDQLEKARRLQDFPTDGLVFKVDDLAAQNELGCGTTAPRWAVAFKYSPDRVKTRVASIDWTVGKTGKVTPVANLDPVLISGTIVARASLCNVDEIKRLGVNVGDEVLIEKSNEIIPKIVQVAVRHSKQHAPPPRKCPACDSAVQHFEGYVDLFCVNPTCKAQLEARLVYAAGKNALDIDGCGPQAIATFIASGVNTLPALLKSDCACFKGAAKKKLQAGLAASMKAPFWRKLAALCIDTWGKTTCQEVATRWPSMTLVLDARDDKQLDFIISETKAREFRCYFNVHEAEVTELLAMLFFPEEVEKVEGALTGKSFCITGSIPGCPDRSIVEEEIRKRGGIVKSSVSSKLTFLVVGDEPGTNKLTGARRWGTQLFTADQLFDLLNWRPAFSAPDPTREY